MAILSWVVNVRLYHHIGLICVVLIHLVTLSYFIKNHPLEKLLSIASVNGVVMPEVIHFATRNRFSSTSYPVLCPTSISQLFMDLPWLQKHTLVIHWNDLLTGEIPATYVASLLFSAFVSSYRSVIYWLCRCFYETRGWGFSPQRPYDCALDLLPSATPPPHGSV